MEELCGMLTHKLKLINNQIDYKNMSKSEKDELLDILLIEKKKQSWRVLVESRLQQAMATRHITLDEEINQIKSKSYQIMKIHLPDLSLPVQANPLESMVKLFSSFFAAVYCSNRSQQIQSIYEKRLCPKSLMASTMFNWFVEWARKQFKQYLKVHIHSLYVNSRQSASVSKEASIEKEKEEGERNNRFVELSGISLENLPKKSILHQREIKKKEQRGQKELPKSLQSLRIMSQKSIRVLNRENSIEDQSCPINREVFLFAFAQELQIFYKSIQDCIPDLESGWARRLKKGWRRQEVLRRVGVVAESCIKQMPEIKQSVDQYYQFYKKNYTEKYGQLKQAKSRKKEVQILKSTIQKVKNKRKKVERQSFDKTDQKDHKRDIPDKRQTEKELIQRNISTTEKLIKSKERKLTSSVARNHRYELDSEEEGPSNLLMTANKQTRAPKNRIQSLEVSHKTIDLAFDRQKVESTYLFLNPKSFTHELQIIEEERAKKMKARVMHGRSKKKYFSPNKQKIPREHYRSLEIQKNNGKAFKSVEQTNDRSEKLYIKLPKVKGVK